MKNQNLTSFSRILRTTMTDAERKIWHYLRKQRLHTAKFRRQHIIGDYIVDFICLPRKLIIEIDGGQHTETADRKRTEFLEKEGYKILRFWNNDVLGNSEGVLQTISQELSHPHPDLPPSRGKEKQKSPPPQGGRVRVAEK